MKILYLSICFILVFSLSYAQDKPDSSKLFQEFKIIPLPVLAANPAVGFMYGLAPSASW